jgi:hypothetical protein
MLAAQAKAKILLLLHFFFFDSDFAALFASFSKRSGMLDCQFTGFLLNHGQSGVQSCKKTRRHATDNTGANKTLTRIEMLSPANQM